LEQARREIFVAFHSTARALNKLFKVEPIRAAKAKPVLQ
jgi:hypothetical protein